MYEITIHSVSTTNISEIKFLLSNETGRKVFWVASEHYWVHWSATTIIIFDVNGFMHSLVVVLVVPKTFFPFANPFDSSRHHFLAGL